MTFTEALIAARDQPIMRVRIARENGPAFDLDEMGQLFLVDGSALYLGDIIDLDDWKVDTLPTEVAT